MRQHRTVEPSVLPTSEAAGRHLPLRVGDVVEVEYPDGSREALRIPLEAGANQTDPDRRGGSAAADVALLDALVGRSVGERITVCSAAGVYSATILGRAQGDGLPA